MAVELPSIDISTPEGIEGLYAAIAEFADAIGQQIIDAAVPPVDTGFLEASAYVLSQTTNTFDRTWESGAYMSSKGFGLQQRERVAYPVVGGDRVVIVGWSAIYAWYLEDSQPFMYPALLSVAEG